MDDKMGNQSKEPPVFETWRFKTIFLLGKSFKIENVGRNKEWNDSYGWLCNHEFANDGTCVRCRESSITKVVINQSHFHLGHKLIDWATARRDTEYIKALQAIKNSCDICPPDKKTYCNLCNPKDEWTEDKSRCDFCFVSWDDIIMQYLQLHPVKCYECKTNFGIGDDVCHILVVDNNRKTGVEIGPSPIDGSKFEIRYREEHGVCRECTERNKRDYKTPLYQIDESKPIGKIPEYDFIRNKWKTD